MKLSVIQGDLTKTNCDLLVVNLFEGVKTPGGATGAVDKTLNGLVLQIIQDEEFKGKEGDTRLIDTHGKIPAKKILLIGLGKQKEFTAETVRKVAGQTVKIGQQIKIKAIASILHGGGIGGLEAGEAAQAMAEGALLAAYTFDKHKSVKNPNHKTDIQELAIVERSTDKVDRIKRAVAKAQLYAQATIYTRDLVNEPPGLMTPKHLAEHAKKLADESTEVIIYNQEKLAEMGAGALLGIARGSDEPPYLLHLIYRPTRQNSRLRQGFGGRANIKTQISNKYQNPNSKYPKIVLVGKGITFDSGGLGIKTAEGMNTMKMDMAGAAVVLGVFSALPKLKPNVEVHGVIATCENMISGRAVKPGDVLRSLSNKTIEINHTDAEGRVVLADALELAKQQKPDQIIDFATLTGACLVALGDQYAGLFSNNRRLAEDLKLAAKIEGEKIWELPLVPEYKEHLKSDIADLSNAHKTRYGGAILGAMFLQEFVGTVPWAHFDIAGPAFAEKELNGYTPKGATGFGVRMILGYLKTL